MMSQEQRQKVIADLHAAGNSTATVIKVTKSPQKDYVWRRQAIEE